MIEDMSIRDDQAHEVASLYYLQGQTMETIARQMRVSRSSVSRMLAYAREVGLVRISVAAPPGTHGTLAGKFRDYFGINAWVVPVRDVDTDLSRLQSVAQVAAERLTDLMEPGGTLGVAWGNTTSAITQYLPKVAMPESTVVQLNGAASAMDTGMPYVDSIISRFAEAFDSRMMLFPVPAFFDYAETKEAMWRERSVKRVLEEIDSCSVALFGVGSLTGKLLSHVYSGGFLDPEELEAAKNDGVVGDVCTVLLRENGSTEMELNRRASGPSPHQLKHIPRRLCVVSGDSKAIPLIGALRTGVITDLVLDSSVAQVVINRLRGRGTQDPLQKKR